MVVGWEGEVSTHADATSRNFGRRRQLLQWFFAAAPGHPVLRKLCDHIARNAMNSFSANPVRDTLERTGPAVFTDMVLEHALSHPIAKVQGLSRQAAGHTQQHKLQQQQQQLVCGATCIHQRHYGTAAKATNQSKRKSSNV
jgi:hypothetical protein